MNSLFKVTFSGEFIARWRFFLKKLYNYSFHEEFAVVPSLWRKKTYSYLPLVNYTDRTSEQVGDLLDKVKEKNYQIRVLNFKYRDFQKNDTVTMRIDLNKPDMEELFSTVLSKRNKRYIRQIETQEAQTRKGDSSDLISDFYDVFSDVMHRHGTPIFSKSLFFTLPRTFTATYYVVYKEAVPVSAAVVIDDEKISWIPWSGTRTEYMDSRPGLIMYWETIKDAFLKKKLIYDFGRSSYGSGPYVYKSRWGAVPVKIDILQPKVSNVYRKYSHASYVWKKIPSEAARWLGPKICKYLSDL